METELILSLAIEIADALEAAQTPLHLRFGRITVENRDYH